jgi:hypothetical protein
MKKRKLPGFLKNHSVSVFPCPLVFGELFIGVLNALNKDPNIDMTLNIGPYWFH